MKLNNKGMSLLELLVSIVLIGIVLVFLFQLLVDVRNEKDNKDFASNNQINRIELTKKIEEDLINHKLISIEDLSSNNYIHLNFNYEDDGNIKVAVLSTEELESDDTLYYLRYHDVMGKDTSWLIDGGIISSCATFTFHKDLEASSYYFKLNIPIYNLTYNEKNNKDNNNVVDDLEITHIGNIFDLEENTNSLTNENIKTNIGNCTN